MWGTPFKILERGEHTHKSKFYKLHPRRLQTWKFSRDRSNNIVQNQIDYYTLINRRFQNSIKRVAASPGADIASRSMQPMEKLRAIAD